MKPGILDHHFGAEYASRLRARDGHMPAALTGLREQARSVFGSQGLPGPKREEWRFTPLRALAKIPFVPASHDIAARVPDSVPVFTGAARIVLVNGVYRRDLSDDAGARVKIGDLHALFEKGAAPERNILGRLAQAADSPLVALNAAYMTDGLDIHVTGAAEKTLHVVSLAAPGDEPSAFHPRVVVVLDPGASLTLIETHLTLPGAASFANPVTEISLGAGATLRRYVQVEAADTAYHLATTAVAMAEKANFEAFHLGVGAGEAITRQEISVALHGPGAQLKLGGAYALGAASHHDFTTAIDHHAGACASNQVFKGVVDGQSHGVYQGRIHVARDAQKTDARQVHKALFLARGAAIDVKPELEIYADDVQCAHGAATGEIDPDHLFYLQARGIDPETARLLLVEGFLAEALDGISHDGVRGCFGAAVTRWLAARRPS
jgi:Fe-S cluster assembly protein SufD